MSIFKKKPLNDLEGAKKIDLYVPEQIIEDRYSTWRKPQRYYLEDKTAQRKLLKIINATIHMSGVLNLIFALIVLIGVINLLFFTDFERVVFDDGTYASCVIEPDGTINSSF